MREKEITWFGTLPDQWQVSTIGSLYAVRNEKVSDTDYPPLSVTMKGVVPQLETAAKTDAHDDRKLVKKGDFAINSRSDRRGSCGISEYDGSVSLINTILTPRVKMNPHYYNLLFHTAEFADEFYKWGHGIVDDLWTTRWQEMKNIILPIPSLAEQERIFVYVSKRVSQIDALIANQEKQIEKLKQYKQTLITETVTKGLDPTVPMKDSGVEWIGSIPKHWTIVRFKQIASVKSNLVNPLEYLSYPQVSPENIEKGSGKLFPCQTVGEVGVESNNHLFRVGQILYSKVRPILNKVAIAPFDGLCSADMYPIETILNVQYLLYLMLSNVFLYQVKLVTENRVKMPKINQEEISQIKLCCAPDKEQYAIVSYLNLRCSQIDILTSKLEQKIEKLNQYKKSLIYEYVTGKKEVLA